MPDIAGDKLDSAKRVLESQELDLNIVVEEIFDSVVPAGDVVRTDPEKNQELQTGQTVTLYVSKGPQLVEIKKLVGLSVDAAVSILKADGFTNYEIEPVESEKEKDTLIELRSGDQVLKAGDKVDVNAKIVLVVSHGKNPVQQVTKDVVIDLKDCAKESDCDIVIKCNGKVVYTGTVAKGENSVTLKNQAGRGTVDYELIVGDETWSIQRVQF